MVGSFSPRSSTRDGLSWLLFLKATHADPHIVHICVGIITWMNMRIAEFAVFVVPTVLDNLRANWKLFVASQPSDTAYLPTISCRGFHLNCVGCVKNYFCPFLGLIDGFHV